MADNNDLKVIVGLDLPKSLIEVEGDLKILKKMLDRTDGGKLKITAGLNLGKTIGNINTQIKQVEKSVNAIKLTPQLDVSNNQINTQFSEQFERIKKTINFHDVALTIKKEMSLIKEAGGDVTKEIENQLAVISESFGKEPEKVKDAFDKIYSIFEQYSSLYRRSNQEKRKILDGLNTTFLQDPNIVGSDKNTVGANISKEWFKRIVSAFSNDEEAAKKAIRSIFGRVSIAAEDGLKTGLHQLDTLMKEYTDPLTKRKLNPEETFAAFYEARQKAMATFPDDTELQLDVIETAKKKIEQLINTNLHLVEVNQQVADSENQVAQAQHNVNDNQVSLNNDNEAKIIQEQIDLNKQLVTSDEKINALESERVRIQKEISNIQAQIDSSFEFDDVSDLESALNKNKSDLLSIENSIASETTNNEAIKNQIQTLTQQLEQEKKSVESTTKRFTDVVGNEIYASNQTIERTFVSLEEAEQYFKDFNLGEVSTVFTKDAEQLIDSFIIKVKGATGVVEKFRYAIQSESDDEYGVPLFELKNITAANEGVERLRQQIEDIKSRYTKKIDVLEANNPVSASGLAGEIIAFRKMLDGLGSSASLKEVDRAFNEILSKSTKITSNLRSATASLNPQENALNHYREMDNIVSDISTQYNNLVVKNESLGLAIETVKGHLTELKDLQETEGAYTEKWSEKYHEVNVELAGVVKLINEAVKAESKSAKADKASQYQVQLGHLNKIVEAQNLIVSLEKRKINAGQEETAEIRKQIKAAEERIKYHTRELEKKKLLASITQKINENENKAGKQNDLTAAKRVDNLTAKYKEMSQNIIESISNLQKLKDNPLLSGNDSTAANSIIAQIDSVINAYRELFEVANTNSSTISAENIDNDTRAFNRLSNEINTVNASVKDVNASFSQLKADSIATEKLDKDFASLGIDVDNTIKRLNTLNNSAIFRNHNTDSGVVQFKQELASLIEKYNQLKTALSSTPKTSEAFQQLKQQADALGVKLKQAKIRNDELQAGLRNADGATQLTARVQKLTAQIKEYMSVNTKAAKKYSAQFDNLLSGLSAAEINKDSVAVRNLTNDFQLLKSQIKSAGDTGLTLFERIKKDISKFSGWLSITTVISTGVREIRKMVTNVIELDNSLLELSKVSDLTASGIKNVTDRAFELSKQVGKTGTDVINAVTNFKRAGFELEQSMDLAEKALVLTNVAEGIDDASEAATALISIMKGYGDTSAEFAQKILDAVNEVSNTQAIDFDSLIEGSQRLAAVAKQGGASFEQMLGILTGTNEVLQNIEKTSTGAITIFTRLQSIQLPDEEDVMPLAKLQETFSKNTGGIVNIVDQTTGQLRNVYDILNDISEVWDTLDKNTQEGLAFAAAGTRQKNVFLSMMENWENVKKSVESAANSVGSATEENQKYLDSISGRLKMVESNFQSLSQTIVNSDFVKFLVSAFGEFLGTIDNIISKFGTLQTLLPIVLGSLSAFKNVGRHKMSCLKMEYADFNVVVTRNEPITA